MPQHYASPGTQPVRLANPAHAASRQHSAEWSSAPPSWSSPPPSARRSSSAHSTDSDQFGSPVFSITIPEQVDRWPHVMSARPRAEGELRCVVRQSDAHAGELQLHVEEGNVFLLSAQMVGRDWLISGHANVTERRALARLRCGSDGSFTCVRQRALLESTSAGGNAVPEHLHVRHATEQFSDELPELNTLHAALPRACDRRASPPSPGAPPSPDGKVRAPFELPAGELARELHAGERGGGGGGGGGGANLQTEGVVLLSTKRPRWNARTDAYELPFHGRASLASERNFQLVCVDEPERVVLLHGKLDDEPQSLFSLDFAHPLSPLQAFALCLSTSRW